VQLTLRGELAFVTATVAHERAAITVPDFLVDTGAASSVLNADIAGMQESLSALSTDCACFVGSAAVNMCSSAG
jgi:predicted aspartyl protease